MRTYENKILGTIKAERITDSNINPELASFLTGVGYDWLVHAGNVQVPLTDNVFTGNFSQVRETV